MERKINVSDQSVRTYPLPGKPMEYDNTVEDYPFLRNILLGAVMLFILFFSGGFLAGDIIALARVDLVLAERDFKALGGLVLFFFVSASIALASLAKLISCMVKAVRADL